MLDLVLAEVGGIITGISLIPAMFLAFDRNDESVREVCIPLFRKMVWLPIIWWTMATVIWRLT